VDGARIAEAHLDFGRMYVDVHAAWIDLEEQQPGGLALAVQLVAVSLAHRVREHAVAHVAAVDEQVLRVGARPRGLWRAGDAVQAQAARLRLDREARLEKFATEQRSRPLTERLHAQVRRDAAVVLQGEGDVRARERDAPEGFLAVAELGLLGAQEFLARRRIEIEVFDQHRRPGRARRGGRRACVAAFGADAGCVPGFFLPAGDREARHGRDRGERLAAKAHAGHALQVFQRLDLARGVARERERQLVPVEARAVVVHLHALRAALVERHLDLGGARVERILEQLLQHRGGPLDHLACGDLADQQLGQDANGGHARSI
jgi:hypothetical protein